MPGKSTNKVDCLSPTPDPTSETMKLRPAISAKSRLPLCLLTALLIPSSLVFAQATTGFIQTDAGPYDYNDAGNWVGGTSGDISGIWDASLVTTATQTVTFGADTTLTTGLDIGYTGNFDLNFTSDGTADRTLTLGDDITVNPASNRTITIGSSTADTGLNVALGGDRTFTVTGAKTLRFYNAITGGNLTINGGTTSNTSTSSGGTVRLQGDNATASGSTISVTNFSTLFFGSDVSNSMGATRAQNVSLSSGSQLYLQGNNGANSVDTISGNLTINGSGYTGKISSGGMPSITVRNGTKNTLLSVGSLTRENNAVLFIRGTNLGTTSIASATAGNTNIQVTGTAPTLVGGGGAAGSTTISILPWAVGATTYNSTAPTTFLTYTAANGFRPLDTATEFAGAFGGNTTDNVRLTATTDTVISGDATVNSLILSGQGGSISGTGTLTVTSGAILLTRTTGSSSNINVNLNFGTAEGIITYVRGDVINGAIAGSGGLTVLGNRTDEPMQMKNGSSTYTGDTHILGNVQAVAGFLPYGSRTGDIYLSGNLQLDVGGFNGSINGLNGNGTVQYGNSGNSSLAIGDNNASGTFDGKVISNTNLAFSKIGTGTQILNGDNTISGTVSANAGTLLFNGTSTTGAISVASGARFGGSGSVTGRATLSAADSVLIAGGDGSIGNLTLSGGLTAANGATFNFDANGASVDTIDFGSASLDLQGTVTVNFNDLGSLQTGTAYSLLTGSGDWSSSVSASFVFDSPTGYELDTSYGSGNGYVFDAINHELSVQFVSTGAIPEPSTAALIGGAVVMLIATGRRRKS